MEPDTRKLWEMRKQKKLSKEVTQPVKYLLGTYSGKTQSQVLGNIIIVYI